MSNAIEKATFPFARTLIAVFLMWGIVSACPSRIVAETGDQQEAPGQVDEPAQVDALIEPVAVIPPGREDLLAEMLGRGTTLPGECTFTSGKIDRNTVEATYACPGGPVVVTLRHPSQATSGATVTDQFAIAVLSGTPPAQLVEELASRIRSRERDFQWVWVGTQATGRRSLPMLVVTAVLAGAVLWLAFRRRKAKG